MRESNPRPLAPEARIIPLDQIPRFGGVVRGPHHAPQSITDYTIRQTGFNKTIRVDIVVFTPFTQPLTDRCPAPVLPTAHLGPTCKHRSINTALGQASCTASWQHKLQLTLRRSAVPEMSPEMLDVRSNTHPANQQGNNVVRCSYQQHSVQLWR